MKNFNQIKLHTYFIWFALSILACVTFSSNAKSGKKSSQISLEQLVEMESVLGSYTSPDGQHIAYTKLVPRDIYKDKDGGSYVELHLTNLAGESRPFITGEVNVSSVQWSLDSQFIYYLAKRNDDKFKSVYRIAVNGGESQKVASIKSNISAYSVNKDASRLVFLAKPAKGKHYKTLKEKGFKAKVYEESVKKTQLFALDLTDKSAKPKVIEIKEHVLSAKFSPADNKLLVRVAPTALIDDNYTASSYQVINLKGKPIQKFVTQGKLGQAVWSHDGKKVAIIGAAGINDPADGRLFVGSVKNGKVTEVLKDYQGHVKAVAWMSNYQLAYLGNIGTKSEVSSINLDSLKTTTLIAPGKNFVKTISFDTSGKLISSVVSSSSHPREVYAYLQGTEKRLTNLHPWLADVKMPKQESISYQARDGLSLDGILVYPTNYKKGKRYPLIMMVHGGPESHISDEWLDRYSYPIKHAAANGFAVFLPNYRGSTGRGVEFSMKGQADYAGAEFNDLVDAISHLSKMGLVDKKRVGITGGSYGGYASAWAATALSEHFAASVMFVGISNQLSKFGTTDIPKEMYNVHARNYPWDKWQWMLERSPIYHTDKANTPILIMHGEEDTRVHPSQSMELYRYIKTRTDTPVRLVFYPSEGHGNRKAAAQLDYSMRLMRWMEFYLKGDNKGKQIPEYELNHQQYLNKKADKED
ncbi:prolyl oligopeptidase family serine peptidase [Aliikangiella sp. IMCC44653]